MKASSSSSSANAAIDCLVACSGGSANHFESEMEENPWIQIELSDSTEVLGVVAYLSSERLGEFTNIRQEISSLFGERNEAL